jgi:2-hydroxycyclohexanecarboxyl-CoA dehydrogenase
MNMNDVQLNLSGRVVLVTGAGGGVGRAIAVAFAQAGARVAIVDVSDTGLADTLKLIEATGTRGHAQAADIADPVAMQAWAASVDKALGAPEVLVNNAAVMTQVGPFADIDPVSWARDIRVGLLGTMTCTHAVLPYLLRAGKDGVVVNIASDAGRAGNANLTGYSATKGGVIAFTKALAQEVGPAGVRVNAISPGSVRAPMRDQVLQEIGERLGAEGIEEREAKRTLQVPLRRVAEPEDIAHPVLFLASYLARHITGQVLSVNGGFRMY